MSTRAVDAVFAFVRVAEFEILFFTFFFIALLLFKELTSRPEYNQILVKGQVMTTTGFSRRKATATV